MHDYFPLFVVPSIVKNSQTVFHKKDEKLTFEIEGVVMEELLELCDGRHEMEEILNQLGKKWDASLISQLLTELHIRKVVLDSRMLHTEISGYMENPPYFRPTVTDDQVSQLVEEAKTRHHVDIPNTTYSVSSKDVISLFDKRYSVREFAENAVELQALVNVLWSGYGEISYNSQENQKRVIRRTVPSAGALYPLALTLVLFKETDELSMGVYRVWMGAHKRVGFSFVSSDTAKVLRSFVDPVAAENSAGLIVVSGSFDISAAKYGNRGVLYVILEAGHVAQNLHIAAKEENIGTAEIGGFFESPLKESIQLDVQYQPLTSILFGHEDDQWNEGSSTQDFKLEVRWEVPHAANYRLPFAMAFSQVPLQGVHSMSCGRALSPYLAQTKALSEAREWGAAACVSKDVRHTSFSKLENAIDPRVIVRYDRAQYRIKNFPFGRFKEKGVYEWVKGTNEVLGDEVYVLADCVYFPYEPNRPKYTHANSSGVAAHPDRDQAIQNGVLELIERDAFMVVYLGMLTRPTVEPSTLPNSIRERIQHLEDNGFQVWIKDFSLDLAPVVFVYVQNITLSFTSCAGCARFDVAQALDHALMEVESSVLVHFRYGSSGAIRPEMVNTPRDHGTLYEQEKYFQYADFLVHGGVMISFDEVGVNLPASWSGFCNQVFSAQWNLYTVDLHLDPDKGGNKGLHIVRSLVPGLVPISFGYQEEPRGVSRIQSIAQKFAEKTVHYKDMPKLPHPYT